MEPTPGSKSSEFSLAKIVSYAGIALTVAGAALTPLAHMTGAPSWAGPALAALGVATKLVAFLGYNAGRKELKIAEIAGAGAVEVAKILPLLQEAMQALREKDPPEAPPSPTPGATPPAPSQTSAP